MHARTCTQRNNYRGTAGNRGCIIKQVDINIHTFRMLQFTVQILLVIFLPATWATHPSGHLEKLGSHQASEGHVDVLDGAASLPDPVEFYRRYVERQRPVVIRQAVVSTPALQKWTDKFLMYGVDTSGY